MTTSRSSGGRRRDRLRRSVPVDPRAYHLRRGQVYSVLGRCPDAIDPFRRVLKSNPASVKLPIWLGARLAEAGKLDQTGWEVEPVLRANPDFSVNEITLDFPNPRTLSATRLTQCLREAGLAR